MSKHNILASISMLFDNLSPPWSRLPATEQLIQMENRQQARERLVREVESVFSQRDELLAALKACIDYGSMTGDEWVFDKARAAIAKAEGGQDE